ncbi:MAG: hypothetical protein IJW40_09420 [Clostridia bacterium]|nr:hypothetical protein [Clostridia bacterium]
MAHIAYRFQKSVDFLLQNACPSIRYLVHRDLLNTPMDEPGMRSLQAELLRQSNVQKHLAAQHDDGWFGHELHGNDGMDGHIGALLNYGVEPSHPAIQKGIVALMTPEIAAQHKNWFRGGDALDAGERGGNRAVTAGILSWVHMPEDTPMLREEIALSWEHLCAVKTYTSIDDFSVRGSSERYYKPLVRFPGANHISLLAATQGWRSETNMKIAKEAATHAYVLMKGVDEYITFRKSREYGGGVIGPFNYNWQALRPHNKEDICGIINAPYNFQFAFWLGAVSGVPDWMRQSTETYEVLADVLECDVLFDSIPDRVLKAFRQVLGKEPVWRGCAARCDVIYAVLRACYPVLK